jgi:hypothetical protein
MNAKAIYFAIMGALEEPNQVNGWAHLMLLLLLLLE